MSRNSIVAIIVVVVIVLIGAFFFFGSNPSNDNAGESQHAITQ